jgi:hypothetical protein
MLKLEAGLPLDSRSFKYVADLAIEEMQQDLDAGMGKASYHDYIRALEKFKDFFKNKYLANITNQDLRRFDAERTKELLARKKIGHLKSKRSATHSQKDRPPCGKVPGYSSNHIWGGIDGQKKKPTGRGIADGAGSRGTAAV